jgi:pyrroline-5-carboxylate reductase
MTDLKNMTLAVIGGGQMAEALVAGVLGSQRLEPRQIAVTDPVAARRDLLKSRFGVAVGTDNAAAAQRADVIVLAVKPQTMAAVLPELRAAAERKLVISIAAGVSLATLAAGLPGARLVRVMPNTPALVGEGMSVFSPGAGATAEDLARVRALLEAVGRVATVEEPLLDAVTGLSGSGPAYVFAAIEALADGGVKMGLPRQIADVLAAQTVLGAARMQVETGEHPARLKDRVASPGGTTIAGLHALEQGGLRAALIAAVEAATQRSKELGR